MGNSPPLRVNAHESNPPSESFPSGRIAHALSIRTTHSRTWYLGTLFERNRRHNVSGQHFNPVFPLPHAASHLDKTFPGSLTLASFAPRPGKPPASSTVAVTAVAAVTAVSTFTSTDDIRSSATHSSMLRVCRARSRKWGELQVIYAVLQHLSASKALLDPIKHRG